MRVDCEQEEMGETLQAWGKSVKRHRGKGYGDVQKVIISQLETSYILEGQAKKDVDQGGSQQMSFSCFFFSLDGFPDDSNFEKH